MLQTEIVIRRATVGEADRLTDIAMASKAYWGYGDVFMKAARSDIAVIPESLPDFWVWVLERRGQACGFYSLDRIDGEPQVVELAHLFVAPEAIGQSFGRRLWSSACAEARRLGFARLRLTADPNAEAFYQRCGAMTIGVAPSPVVPGRMLPLMEAALAGVWQDTRSSR